MAGDPGTTVMGMKLTAFGLALIRWTALVALAVVPTVLVVVAYRKWRGLPLWSLQDLPAAAEVTLALAWLSLLMNAHEMLLAHWSGLPGGPVWALLAAAVVAAAPAAVALEQIATLRRLLARRWQVHLEPAAV